MISWWLALSELKRGALCGLLLVVLTVLLTALFNDGAAGEFLTLDTWRSTHIAQALLIVFVMGFGIGVAAGPN